MCHLKQCRKIKKVHNRLFLCQPKYSAKKKNSVWGTTFKLTTQPALIVDNV